MSEVERFRAALQKINRDMPHHGCHGCAACIAHNALYGHWPTWGIRCCWPKAPASYAGRTRSSSGY